MNLSRLSDCRVVVVFDLSMKCTSKVMQKKKDLTIICNRSSYYCNKEQQIGYHYFCDFVGKTITKPF